MIHRNGLHRFLSTALLLFTVAISSLGQAGPKKPRELGDYSPGTLKEISERKGTAAENSNKNITIHGKIFPTRVTVVFEGAFRPLPQNKKDTIAAWANRFAGAPETYTRPYQQEVLVSEDGSKHWLAVRTELLPKFEQELKKGDTVDLCLIKLGSARNGKEWQPVLLVEKFLKP